MRKSLQGKNFLRLKPRLCRHDFFSFDLDSRKFLVKTWLSNITAFTNNQMSKSFQTEISYSKTFTFYLRKRLYAEGTFTVQPVVYHLTFMHFTFNLFCILASEKKVINKLDLMLHWTYRALNWKSVPNLNTTLVNAFKLFVWYEKEMQQIRSFLSSLKIDVCLQKRSFFNQIYEYFFMRCRSK